MFTTTCLSQCSTASAVCREDQHQRRKAQGCAGQDSGVGVHGDEGAVNYMGCWLPTDSRKRPR